ncbi:hypothetical protein VitviT2T_029784 [Vitis vinifera]|uniref:Protein NDR1 n=2 Tax=Vitis vinifera TaxID=29760 RepID=A0ABY9DZS1_VITVI|nr:protein NDR1 [Vitis vinifera]WKA12399.1 hypothetical protein VitviT2T_029784 [Vitis vinifera]|eukprot:XP_002282205.1 PREDICTED: protein NDR1 [Vitis vinifera]
MAESAGGCCRCCCSFIFTLGLTALFMWLSLRTSNPTCSIQYFYAPSLNRTLNTTNSSLYFDLKLDNGNKDKGIYYDPINLTFYYGFTPNFSVGNLTVPAFYQGHKKNARRRMLVQTPSVPWPEARTNGTVWFRMDLQTKVRFKILFWNTKREKISVSAPVEVNATDGKKIHKKGIKLKSGAPERWRNRAPVGLLGILATGILVVF